MYTSRSHLEEMFRYHPPKSEARIQKHMDINQSALDFALMVYDTVSDDKAREIIINQIQVARMLANQYITYEDVYAGDSQ